jgi:hypothetical protein
MPEPTPTSRKITLEELLRLKRHERPGPEYWARFDRELNEKVWRTLVQPTPRTDWLAVLWSRRTRWLAAGVTAVAAIFFSWSGRTAGPIVALRPTSTTQVAAHDVSAPEFLPASEPVRVAAVFPRAEEKQDVLPTNALPQYAVSTLDTSSNPAGYNKVPATVAFAVERPNGERYASDTLSTAASAHWRESAY